MHLYELTSRLSSSWMYIAYMYLYCLIYAKRKKNIIYVFSVCTLCWWIDKKGERNLEFLYMHVCLICYLLPLISRAFFGWYQEHFLLVSRACLFHWYQISCLCIFMLSIHGISLLFIAMHELRGSFYEA